MNIRKAKKNFKKKHKIKDYVKTQVYRNLRGDIIDVSFRGMIILVKQNGNRYKYNNSFDEVSQIVFEREKLFKGFHQKMLELLRKQRTIEVFEPKHIIIDHSMNV